VIFMKASHTLAFCLGVIGIALILAESSTGPASRTGVDANHGNHTAPAEPPPPPGERPAMADEGATTNDDSWYDSPIAEEEPEPAVTGDQHGAARPDAEYAPDTPPTADAPPPREQA
jgi:hypothetical protein